MPCQCGYPDGMSPLGGWFSFGLRPRGNMHREAILIEIYLDDVRCNVGKMLHMQRLANLLSVNDDEIRLRDAQNNHRSITITAE